MQSFVYQIFDYCSYFEIIDGITRYYPCILKRDVCPDLRTGNIVDEIVIYNDGKMEIYNHGRKYLLDLYLCTGIPTISFVD